MNLYYGLTNYHLLCCILHKLIYNKKEKSIFLCSQGILKNRIENLKKSKIFDEVYYIEDSQIRDTCFKNAIHNMTYSKMQNITQNFIIKYEEILPINIENINEFYIAADHGVFGIYLLMKQKPYIYLEDGRGIYSKWSILDKLLGIKNPCVQVMASYYNAYGKSSLIKKKLISFDSQLPNCNLHNCYNFDVNILIDKLSDKQRKEVFNIFNVNTHMYDNDNKKIALVLTQRFATYKMLDEDDCILLYAILCDIFASNYRVYIKPHPADKCDYSKVFKKEIILEKEIPSELIRYMVKKNFDIGISTYSSSIDSLKPYINKLYDIDETITNFKQDIFKLYVIFEMAKKYNGSVITDKKLLDQNFYKCYNLKNNSNIIFNYSSKKSNLECIKIKNKYFKGSNICIKITKNIVGKEKRYQYKDDILYMKINDGNLLRRIMQFELDTILSLSKVHISTKIKYINKE